MLYFIHSRRGFYSGSTKHATLDTHVWALRRATPFESYQAADDFARELYRDTKRGYYAILANCI